MNTKEAITFPEFVKEFNTVQYKYVGLYGMEGNPIVRFNGTKTPLKDKLEEIKRRLDSKALGDGFYKAMCKNQTGGKVECDEYIIKKGNPDSMPQSYTMINSSQNPAPAAEILTYESALDLETQIIRLQSRNDILVTENERLQDEVEILKEERSELLMDKEVLSDEAKAPSFMSQIKEIAEGVMPMFEEHYELQRADREIEAAKLKTQRQMYGLDPLANGDYVQSGQIQQQQQQQQQAPGEPALYENLSQEQLAQYSEPQQKQLWSDYCNRLRAADPEAYNKLMKDLQEQQDGQGA